MEILMEILFFLNPLDFCFQHTIYFAHKNEIYGHFI